MHSDCFLGRDTRESFTISLPISCLHVGMDPYCDALDYSVTCYYCYYYCPTSGTVLLHRLLIWIIVLGATSKYYVHQAIIITDATTIFYHFLHQDLDIILVATTIISGLMSSITVLDDDIFLPEDLCCIVCLTSLMSYRKLIAIVLFPS